MSVFFLFSYIVFTVISIKFIRLSPDTSLIS